MPDTIRWHAWPSERLTDALPDLADELERRLDDLPEEHRDKDLAAVRSLRENPIAPFDLPAPARGELAVLGLAYSALGHASANEGDADAALTAFQTSHELFRAMNPSHRPSRLMHQAVVNGLKTLVGTEVARAGREGRAADLREELRAFVASAWGEAPSPLMLQADEMLLEELEAARSGLEADTARHEAFVRANLPSVLGLELPTRAEEVRERWLELGQRVAPELARATAQALRRPRPLSAVVPESLWGELRAAVERGDLDALARALAPHQEAIETNLRLRLDARPDLREPTAELRYQGGPDRFFVEARGLLLQPGAGAEALSRFREIHHHRSSHTVAKEWYAYALARFGQAADVWDVIDLLRVTIASPHFREDLGWTARWNLAVVLRRLPNHADGALDALLPVLQNDSHPAEAFELCLLWALEQDRGDVLPALLERATHAEAHLLAAIDARSSAGEHFRRVNRIMSAPDRVFPDPKERLALGELDAITRDFLESALVTAGGEWFRQRVSYDAERGIFKNWECAAILNEAAGDLPAAWRCRRRQWECTQRNVRVEPHRKAGLLRFLLGWAQRNGFQTEAVELLREGWRGSPLPDGELRLWEQRLLPSIPDVPPRPEEARPPSPEELSRLFQEVGTLEDLAAQSVPAEQLLGLPGVVPPVRAAVRGILRAAGQFDGSPAAIGELWQHLAGLSTHRDGLPGPVAALVGACERVVRDASARGPDAATARARPREVLSASPGRPLALMLDWENVKIGLASALDALPAVDADSLRPRVQAGELARRLLDAAARHGLARQRWAVANWDQQYFLGDQRAVRGAGFLTDLAGDGKPDGSDHVLRERIHAVLREQPEIDTFIIGTGDADFAQVVATLRREGKQVVIWSTRRSASAAYGDGLAGPDRIKIEWLEDLVFGDRVKERIS